MQLLDLTLDTPAENLALDEALLLSAEAAGEPQEVLRLWESRDTFVVVGSSSRIAAEVRLDRCRAAGVPVLRRSSGGAAIVTGPGCLMYSVVLSYEHRPELKAIDRAHRFVLDSLITALQPLTPDVSCRGTSDLTLYDRKFSGNSLRCKRTHLLYHGTLLYNFPLDRLESYLATPPRQPAYRAARPHTDFVSNLPLTANQLRTAISTAFAATAPAAAWPHRLTAELASEKFNSAEWTNRL